MVSFKEVKKWSLNDTADQLYRIFGEAVKSRGVEDTWLSVAEQASKVGEAIRKKDYKETVESTGSLLGWLCSFIKRCQLEDRSSPFRIEKDFARIVFYRYPNKDYLCKANPCTCIADKIWIEYRRKSNGEDALSLEEAEGEFNKHHVDDWTIDQWVKTFRDIFEGTNYVLSIEEIGFHLLEEIGEVARALIDLKYKDNNQQDLKRNLEREIADAFSWLTAVVIKLESNINTIKKKYDKIEPYTLPRMLWDAYEKELSRL